MSRVRTVADRSRRKFLIGAALAPVAALAGTACAESNRKLSQIGNAGLEQLISNEKSRIHATMARDRVDGVAVCLVHGRRPIWTEGFGRTTDIGGRQVDADTMFSIQSTSKHLTATAILLAVQKGILNLDAPITEYLPRFTVNSRFEKYPGLKMTLRLLLSHRAGLTHEAPVGNNYDPRFDSFGEHVESIAKTWLRYPVGERYRYSNLGFDLAGWVLQERTGIAFSEWVRLNLFIPLGMMNSTFDTDEYVGAANRAVGHQDGYASVPLRTPLIPSGGVYISARDMATYATFHVNRGAFGNRQILELRYWNEMHGFALGGDYGLGVIRTDIRFGDTPVRVLGHKGGGFGFGSVFLYCPEAELAWLAMFNRPADAGYDLGKKLFAALLAERFGPRTPRCPRSAPSTIKITRHQQEQLVGSWIGRGGTTEISLDQTTLVMQDGPARRALEFTSPTDAFFFDNNGDLVTYRLFTDESELPSHLECSIAENGLDASDLTFVRVPGAFAPDWVRHIGQYAVDQWGKTGLNVTISRRRECLYLNDARLIEGADRDLFFTVDGEVVDFRQDPAIWKSLRLLRQS